MLAGFDGLNRCGGRGGGGGGSGIVVLTIEIPSSWRDEGGGGGGAAAVKRAGVKSNAVKSDEMEDFGGLPRGVLQK